MKIIEIREKLNNIKDKIYTNIDNWDSTRDKELIKSLYNVLSHNKTWNQEYIDSLRLVIEITQYMYNNSGEDTGLADDEWDVLYDIFRNVALSDIVGAPSIKGRPKRSHKYTRLRGTIDKVFWVRDSDKKDKRRSIEQFVTSCENRLGRKLTDDEAQVQLQAKWDGVSLIMECDENSIVEHALLRGDTDINEAFDVSRLFKGLDVSDIYKSDSKFGLKNECMMTYDNFKLLCKEKEPYNSPRSATTSIINSLTIDKSYLKYLSIMNLRVVEDKDMDTEIILPPMFNIHETANLNDLDDLENKINKLKKYLDTIDYITDVVVIILTNPNIQQKLGRRNNRINNYEAAYKFPPEVKRTTVKDIEFSVGTLGGITPVVKIDPVMIRYNNIKSISFNSIDRYEEMGGLAIGDEVDIRYEIIPYAVISPDCKRSGNPIIKVPTHCPICKTMLEKAPVLRCTNEDCDSRIIGKILNYVVKMRIANISISTITLFYKEGILKTIEDLYKLMRHKDHIVNLDGFGVKKFMNIIEGIEERRSVYDSMLFGSLGIIDVSTKTFDKIFAMYSVDKFIDICEVGAVSKLTKVPSIQTKTANKIIDGIRANMSLIKFLMNELDIKHNDKVYKYSVCFTKVRDSELEELFEKKNILVVDNITSTTKLLIVPDKNTESTKVDKAKAKGIDIVPITDIEIKDGCVKIKIDNNLLSI